MFTPKAPIEPQELVKITEELDKKCSELEGLSYELKSDSRGKDISIRYMKDGDIVVYRLGKTKASVKSKGKRYIMEMNKLDNMHEILYKIEIYKNCHWKDRVLKEYKIEDSISNNRHIRLTIDELQKVCESGFYTIKNNFLDEIESIVIDNLQEEDESCIKTDMLRKYLDNFRKLELSKEYKAYIPEVIIDNNINKVKGYVEDIVNKFDEECKYRLFTIEKNEVIQVKSLEGNIIMNIDLDTFRIEIIDEGVKTLTYGLPINSLPKGFITSYKELEKDIDEDLEIITEYIKELGLERSIKLEKYNRTFEIVENDNGLLKCCEYWKIDTDSIHQLLKQVKENRIENLRRNTEGYIKNINFDWYLKIENLTLPDKFIFKHNGLVIKEFSITSVDLLDKIKNDLKIVIDGIWKDVNKDLINRIEVDICNRDKEYQLKVAIKSGAILVIENLKDKILFKISGADLYDINRAYQMYREAITAYFKTIINSKIKELDNKIEEKNKIVKSEIIKLNDLYEEIFDNIKDGIFEGYKDSKYKKVDSLASKYPKGVVIHRYAEKDTISDSGNLMGQRDALFCRTIVYDLDRREYCVKNSVDSLLCNVISIQYTFKDMSAVTFVEVPCEILRCSGSLLIKSIS